MNNNEKENYIKDVLAIRIKMLGDNEYSKEHSFLKYFSFFPKKLYKYRMFDDYTEDMIENNYIYLCPAKKLDDQFECLTGLKKDFFSDKRKIKRMFIDAVVDLTYLYFNFLTKKEFRKTIKGYLNIKFSIKRREENRLKKSGKKEDKLKLFGALIVSIWEDDSFHDILFNLITKSLKIREKITIGSLTETKCSQVMWEMYSNYYEGYCVEYSTIHSINFQIRTYPVVYKNKKSFNFLKLFISTVLEEILISLSNGEIKRSYKSFDFYKLYLIKYFEWSFQKEWRVVGTSLRKIEAPKISAIYLGKNCSKKNKQLIIKLSEKNGFSVYQQIDNIENLSLDFIKIR